MMRMSVIRPQESEPGRAGSHETALKKFLSVSELAHGSSHDCVKKIGADGKVTWVVDHEHIACCRLRINALFRIAALLAPRKYGNR